MSVSSMISRLESIADSVPYASSVSELRSLGSQAMGTAMAIKEALADQGIFTDSPRMLSLLEQSNYGDDLVTLRENLHIALQQIAGYYRSRML